MLAQLRDHALERAVRLSDRFRIEPPPLREIAQAAGIADVQQRSDLGAAGLLVSRDDGAYTAVVRAEDPPTRQRFSLAHEIGHVLLAQEGHAPDFGHSDPETERVCDEIAATLLLPTRAFEFSAGKRELDVALAAAVRCWASPAAAVLRLPDLRAGAAVIAWATRAQPGGTTKLRVLWAKAPPGIFIPRHAAAPPALDLRQLRINETRELTAELRLGSLRGLFGVQSVRVAPRSATSPEVLSLIVDTTPGSE
jgi:Zn-dependent peptidase ImmA (M78 family)